MITTKIEIKPHLAEYLKGKFNEGEDGPIKIPDSFDLYSLLYDLMDVRPQGKSLDSGNVELILPCRSRGKSPKKFNYFSVTSVEIIGKKVATMMWADLHDLLEHNKHVEGIMYNDTVHIFINKHSINSITEDALLKNYYRWRDKVRKKREKRRYSKKM